MSNKRTVRLIGVALSAGAAAALGGAGLDLSWHTIDGGGVVRSTGGEFELSATIGQPDAGAMTGGEFELTGGFWFPLAPADCNSDGGVNLLDFADFRVCVTGPGNPPVDSECTCFDLDDDDDVDLLDFDAFQRVFGGTGP